MGAGRLHVKQGRGSTRAETHLETVRTWKLKTSFWGQEKTKHKTKTTWEPKTRKPTGWASSRWAPGWVDFLELAYPTRGLVEREIRRFMLMVAKSSWAPFRNHGRIRFPDKINANTNNGFKHGFRLVKDVVHPQY